MERLFPFFDHVSLHGFGSHPAAWLSFHGVVSIVTKRLSGWPFLGAEIELPLKSVFGILAQETKEEHFGCLSAFGFHWKKYVQLNAFSGA